MKTKTVLYEFLIQGETHQVLTWNITKKSLRSVHYTTCFGAYIPDAIVSSLLTLLAVVCKTLPRLTKSKGIPILLLKHDLGVF